MIVVQIAVTVAFPVAAYIFHLEARLEAEPGVASVAFGETLPRQYHSSRRIEVEGMAATAASAEETVHRVTTASVARDFFAAFGAPVLAGRGFHSRRGWPASACSRASCPRAGRWPWSPRRR